MRLKTKVAFTIWAVFLTVFSLLGWIAGSNVGWFIFSLGCNAYTMVVIWALIPSAASRRQQELDRYNWLAQPSELDDYNLALQKHIYKDPKENS